MRRRWLELTLQVLLVLTASLLGIVTNYATSAEDTPFALQVLQRAAVPGIGVLVVLMVAVQIAAYRLERPAPRVRAWDPDRTPYPGLDAFTEAESAVFFGRDGQVAELVRRLHQPTTRTEDRFVVLVGASGSGKSSLVQAGVLPRLRARRWTVLPVLVPGANPLGALAVALADAGPDGMSPATVQRRLRQTPGALAGELNRVRRRTRFGRTLLVIDQLEEVFTLAGDRERAFFLDALREALDADGRLWVLSTARVEFMRDLLTGEHADLFQRPLAIGSMGRAQLALVVREPGAMVDMSFAPGLVETMVEDAGTSDALPLLAYLLQELYYGAGPAATVSEDLYRRLGGVAGALARQADQTVSQLRGSHGVDVVLRTLLRCVTVEGQEAMRRRVPLTELSDAERLVVDAFVDARLLVSGVGEDADGDAYVQVAHEALFRQWPPLRQEVEAESERLRQRAELERWAGDWQRSGRSADYLLTGERLAVAERWLAALEESGQATASVRTLVTESRHRDHAFLRRVSEAAGHHVLADVERSPEFSILLSLAALEDCAPTPVARRALLTSLAFSHLRTELASHTDTVRSVRWSPDGRRLVTGARDGTARVFAAESGRELVVLRGHGAMVEAACWAPDSRRVATAARDHVVRLWDADTGAVIHVLAGAGGPGRGVAWSPDGRSVAATSRDQVVRIWDAGSGALVRELRGHQGDVWGVAWSGDGRRLATASHDRTAIVWDVSTGEAVLRLTGHTDFVEGVAWSPDGRSLATCSGDQTIRISDAVTGRLHLLIRGHTDYVWNMAWAPDGRQIASVSSDRTVRLFDTRDARPVAVFRGHRETVWAVDWSPDGRRIATGSGDSTARVWDLRPRGAEDVVLAGHDGPVNQAAWSPDGRDVATASDDGTVRVWDAAAGEERRGPVRHRDRVRAVAWSPDGGRLLTGSDDRGVRMLTGDVTHEVAGDCPVEAVAWSPDGGRVATTGQDAVLRVRTADGMAEIAAATGHQDWIGGVAWSPSGRLLATASDDRTCRVWDASTHQTLTVLRGHGNYVDAVCWSPDERWVATASGDGTVGLWEAATGRRTGTLRGHEARVRGVAWSPDGSRLATASDDRTVRVWDAATGNETGVVGVHQGKVASIAWSPEGSRLLTASSDGTARIWAAEPDLERLRALARTRVFRTLTEEERRHHMLPSAP